MQRAPTSRKSGSNAPYRPTNFDGAPSLDGGLDALAIYLIVTIYRADRLKTT
jgi:hypothetical protein